MNNTGTMSNREVKEEAVKIMRRMGVSEAFVLQYELLDFVPAFQFGKSSNMISPSSVEWAMKHYKFSYRPYAVTTDTVCGYKMFNFLYVSPYREDLDYMCRQGLSDDMFVVYAYCYNVDRPELSESGSILVEVRNGCIKRVG